MRFPLLILKDKTTARPADGYRGDVIDSIAGIAPRDIESFVGRVAVHLAGLGNVTVAAARAWLDFDLGDEVRAKPMGTGPSAVAEAELSAISRVVALGLVEHFNARSAA